MKRGAKCIAQTINLSNPETCIRPKRIQKLVDSEVMHPCPGAGGTSYWTPRPVAIKICSRREMQRTCPPKLCDCKQKPRITASNRFCNALVFLLKSGIAAGLVYWTRAEGLWGSSADVEDLYCRILETIKPALRNNKAELPRFGELRYSMIQKYNRAVFLVTSYIANASIKLRGLQCLLSSQFQEESKENTEEEKVAKTDVKIEGKAKRPMDVNTERTIKEVILEEESETTASEDPFSDDIGSGW